MKYCSTHRSLFLSSASTWILAAVFLCAATSFAWAQENNVPVVAEAPLISLEPSQTNPGSTVEKTVTTSPTLETSKPKAGIILSSVFLTRDQQIAIAKALEEYKKFVVSNKTKTLNQSNGDKVDGNAEYYTYPQFFLESLVYRAPGDWLVQINGQKIASTDTLEQSDISVVAIDKEKVLVRWRPSELQRVIEAWDKRPIEKNSPRAMYSTVTEMDFKNKISNTVPTVPTTFDRNLKLVVFTLHANQTFSSSDMSVVEGKRAPVVVAIATNKAAAPSEVSEATSVISDANLQTKDEDSNTGLNGLMNKLNSDNTKSKVTP
jgi:hypothetical protein